MKKYFYSDGTTSFGPFTLEELSEKNIAKETKVWFPELGEWKPAGEVSELMGLFNIVPPPITASESNDVSPENFNKQQPPKTWLVESILVTLFCCLPFGIAGIVEAAKVESRFYAGDIDGAERASASAKKWTTISFGIGIAAVLLYLLIVILGVVVGNGYK